MSEVPVPHGIRRDEHYCRRWPSITSLGALADAQATGAAGPVVRVQRSRFLGEGATFFEIALARPLALTEGTNTAVALGFLIDERFRATVGFWDDPAVPQRDVNLTCERCPLGPDECRVRAAPPSVLDEEAVQARRRVALEALGVAVDGPR